MKLILKNALLFYFSTNFAGYAQLKPTPVEFLMGHNRVQSQVTLIKSFSNAKWGLFSLNTMAGDYKNQNKTNNEMYSNLQLNYDIYKGLKLTSGVTFQSFKGFAPIAGLEYVYANQKITAVINPTVELKKESSLGNYAHLEFAPKTKKLEPYARFQILYVSGLAGFHHERSLVALRMGVQKKSFSTGLGLNRDFYGETKIMKPNYGIFIQYKFI